MKLSLSKGTALALLTVACMSRPAPRDGAASANAVPAATAAAPPPAPSESSAPAPVASVAAPESSATTATSAATAVPRPKTAEECRACNGVWARHGLAAVESCNCGTKDSGKRCRDALDCEGQCVAEEKPEREVVEKGPPARGYFVGRCSEQKKVFGCRRFITKGAGKEPRELTEPPHKICFD